MHLLSILTVNANTYKGGLQKMKNVNDRIVISLTIVSVVAIISIMTCCLAALGYNSKISIEKEKIEVTSKSTSIDNEEQGD